MTAQIHPFAVVEDGAELGEGVRVGPFCRVEAAAKIGDGTELISHVSVLGHTTVGNGCQVWPNTILGGDPQNKAHKGGPSRLVIGDNCIIREACTFNRGTDTARGITTVGANGYFMTAVHIAHDCDVGANVTFANGVTLGGHAEVGDYVTIGGWAAVHQFNRVGHHAFLAGMSALTSDLMPFGLALGNRARLRGLNLVGMKRSGMALSEVRLLKNAYRMLFDRSRPFSECLAATKAEFAGNTTVDEWIAFFETRGKRHFCMPGAGDSGGDAAGDG